MRAFAPIVRKKAELQMKHKLLILFCLFLVCSMSLGLTLTIHLLAEKEHHHNSNNCPICRQLIINKTKVILETPPEYLVEEENCFDSQIVYEQAFTEQSLCYSNIGRDPPLYI